MNTDQFIIAINLNKKFNMMNPSAVHSDSKYLKKVATHIQKWPVSFVAIGFDCD